MPAVLCVAAREAQAEALSEALAPVAEVLVVGLSDPTQAVHLASALNVDMIVAPHGTPLPEAEYLPPILTVPDGADPAEALEAYLASAAQAPPDPEPPAVSSHSLPRVPRLLQLRLGFYGVRGGVGTTRAAVTAAQLLATQNRRVALYDAAQRGDPYLLLGLTPTPQPATVGQITIYPTLTLDDTRVNYDALIIDGGRHRWPFPARWLAVARPLDAAEIARIVGQT